MIDKVEMKHCFSENQGTTELILKFIENSQNAAHIFACNIPLPTTTMKKKKIIYSTIAQERIETMPCSKYYFWSKRRDEK